MSRVEERERMGEALRRKRNDCEPKSNQNPRYRRYSNADTALWAIIEGLRNEDAD